jgi:hypothetical protein
MVGLPSLLIAETTDFIHQVNRLSIRRERSMVRHAGVQHSELFLIRLILEADMVNSPGQRAEVSEDSEQLPERYVAELVPVDQVPSIFESVNDVDDRRGKRLK